MKKTNPNFESQVQALRVSVPKFDGGVVHVPGSLSLIFDLAVSVPAKNYIVKTARGLVNKLTEKFAGEIAQNTDGYDLLKLHEDLLLTAENDRASKFREGIQSVDLWKIRFNAEDKEKSWVNMENKLSDGYWNKYGKQLDHEILKDHGVFFPRVLSDELLFELKLAPASNAVIGSDETQLA